MLDKILKYFARKSYPYLILRDSKYLGMYIYLDKTFNR